eukprot:SAG31_NODE_2748_length_5147_cov_2.564184_5_plen_161_part_00
MISLPSVSLLLCSASGFGRVSQIDLLSFEEKKHDSCVIQHSHRTYHVQRMHVFVPGLAILSVTQHRHHRFGVTSKLRLYPKNKDASLCLQSDPSKCTNMNLRTMCLYQLPLQQGRVQITFSSLRSTLAFEPFLCVQSNLTWISACGIVNVIRQVHGWMCS